MKTLVLLILWTIGLLLLLWLVFGINHRSRQRYERAHKRLLTLFEAEDNATLRDLLYGEQRLKDIDPLYRPLSQLLSQDHRPTVSTADDIEIITTGKRKKELILQDILAAKHSIHLEYYHFGWDQGSRDIKRALEQKAREGVQVRFINENIANFPMPPFYYSHMRRAGVKVRHFTMNGLSIIRFLTSVSYRDHRKILVIDGKIGYTGGMNINDNYFLRWRDTHLRLTGPVVGQLQNTFLDTWFRIGGNLTENLSSYFPITQDRLSLPGCLVQITPDEPNSPLPILQAALEWILLHAKKYVWIQSPYIAPPPSVIYSMHNAVRRGVEVKLMIPEHCDTLVMRPINKSYYGMVLDAGVQIYLRGGEFIHSKTIMADDYLTSVGSANLDYRSFGIDYEVNSYIFDKEVTARHKAVWERDLALCRELTMAEVQSTPAVKRLYYRLMQSLSPIM